MPSIIANSRRDLTGNLEKEDEIGAVDANYHVCSAFSPLGDNGKSRTDG